MNIINHGLNKIEIYQIRDIASCNYAFRGYEDAEKCGGVQISDYKRVYRYGEWVDLNEFMVNGSCLLNKIFGKFNVNLPADFNGHSMSVSDLVCINEESWFYVDNIGFKFLGDFEYLTFNGEEFRICDECGDVMQDGFMEESGWWHYCSKECLEKHMTWDEYMEMYEEDAAFYTQWV